MKDIRKEILDILESSNVPVQDWLKVNSLISELSTDQYQRGLDAGQEIMRDTYNIKKP